MPSEFSDEIAEYVDKAREELFGYLIQDIDHGFYVALEFFALVRGVGDLNENDLLRPDAKNVQFKRIAHDWARRMAVGDLTLADSRVIGRINQPETLNVAKALFASLLVEEPGSKSKSKVWKSRHFFPFDGQMVHYDAVERGTGENRKAEIQEQNFRGAGRWVYKALRDDPNDDRRDHVAERLKELLSRNRSALGVLFGTVSGFDEAPSTQNAFPSLDKFHLREDRTKWVERLRAGVLNIVERRQVPQAACIEDLMHWIPFCLARHVLDIACLSVDQETAVLAIDLQPTDVPNQLRTQSQNQVKEFQSVLSNAVRGASRKEAPENIKDDPGLEAAIKIRSKKVRAFFTRTNYAVGLFNSAGGTRNFTMTAPLRRAIVAALIPPKQPMPFDDFCQKVLSEAGMVVGRHGQTRAKWLARIDNGVLSENEEALSSHLLADGLLTKYSDTTSMVHREVR